MLKRTLTALSLVMVVGADAQTTFSNAADYDAWKARYAASRPAPPVVATGISRPAGAPAPGQLRGGSTTCDCWRQPDATYTTIDNNTEWDAAFGFNNADDGSYGPIILPFNFQLYGQNYNQCWINTNGNISFGNFLTSFTANGFPVAGEVLVGAFWADVDLRGVCGGCTTPYNAVQYKVTPTALYVNWTDVGYYSMMTDKLNTFQIIITDGLDPVIPNGGNVSFCYGDMQWTTGSANSGVNGFGGNPANVGANQGNGIDYIQFGRFDQPGPAYDGPFGNNDGIDFLDNQYFSFLTDITLANVPPVISGQSVCDTLVVCVGDSVVLSASFLSPEPNQITTCTASAPTLSNFGILSNTPGVNADITIGFLPTPADAGFHTVTIEGTDNGVPVITSTLSIVLSIQQGATITPGSLTLCDNAAPVDMLTILGGNPPPGGDWTDPNGQPSTGIFDPAVDVPGAYVYAYGTGSNCASTGTATMAVVAHADAGQDVALAYCTTDGTDPLFLNLPGTPQAGGSWLYPDLSPFSGTFDPAADPAGAYAYVVSGTAPCPNDTSLSTITVQQAMDPGLANALTLCPDAPLLDMLDALNGTPDNTGTWSAPGGTPFGGTFNPASDAPGVYTYTTSPLAPCPTLNATLTIALDPLPKAGDDNVLTVCADAPLTDLFSLLGPDADPNQTWSAPGGAVHSGTLNPAVDVSGPYLYVSYGVGECDHLTDSAIVDVTVNPLPIVLFTVDPDSGCAPLDVVFTNLTDPIYLGNSCVWDLGDGSPAANACGTLAHTYVNDGWYNVRLTVTTPEGCTDMLLKQGAVLVQPPPKATFTWSPNPGTDLNSNLYFAASDPYATEFAWDFAGEATGTERFEYHLFENAFGDEYEVCLQVWDRYGCTDTLCQTVPIIVPSLFVPNAFTPDGDGVNEIFLPITADMVPEDHELLIFDRWGQLVFESKEPTKGWDGRHMNGGDILPQGVYVWRLVERKAFTADKQDWFGTVTLLK
ncbi:MAG: gliding motility-associated C-terminal domain-containing protein [Flavobacteriales bacterium]|nr:gliding motility-associated C-terminal domain-containing protein [Flavobacteriales bacterium]